MPDRFAELESELAQLRTERDALAEAVGRARPYGASLEASSIPMMCVWGATGKHAFVNEACAKLFGYSTAEEVEARDPYDVWNESSRPEDRELEGALIARIAKGEIDSYEHERLLLRRNGNPLWARTNAVATRDGHGRLDLLTVYFTDIREQRDTARARQDLEEQLRQAQKLGAVGKLAGGIAHDFNNRLVIIMGHGELLRRALPEDGPLAMHAEMILSSAKRAAELTRQLLAYSRRQVLKPETFDLSKLLERVHQLLASVLGDRIELVTKLHATRLILADSGQIEQVILNLALNARDAMPEGGSLTLETKDVTLATGAHPALPGGDYVALVVRDTGSGIAESVLPHIFEPFFTTKESGQGTGLGLSMVEGIVQQSGGATSVETRIGHGTTFTIYLPQGAGEITNAGQPADTATHDRGTFETVLVCDDDDDVRKLVVDVLELRGYRLLQANGGRSALQVAANHQGSIDLLVTDVAMPEVSGIELAAALRKQRPNVRVLYVSGYTENADLLSTPLGADTHFLAKPFLPGDLTRTVTAILEHQPLASR
jgi:PAS domain S-box-containing protein